MRVICFVKYVPDVDQMQFDYEKNALIRDGARLILNPEDACAVAYALHLRQVDASVTVEVVSMGPPSTAERLKDLARLGADQVTLISDPAFRGSDTYATSVVLAAYVRQTPYHLILTGTHTLDSGTSHIPPQVAELLQLHQFSNVVKIEEITTERVHFVAEVDQDFVQLEMPMPAMLSVNKDINMKLGYVKYQDLERNVDDQLTVITNQDLNLDPSMTGFKGSPTNVKRSHLAQLKATEQQIVQNDEAGIERVYQILKEKGFVDHV